jgi:aminopeptidase YwaD
MIELLGGEIGPRTAGSAAAARAAEAIAEAFRALGLSPHMQVFPLLGYEAGEPELEIDGERWAAGPCVYAHPTPENGVTGRIRKIGEQPRDLGDGKPAPAFAVEDEDGRELGRIYANPVYGDAIPFLSLQHLQITVGPTVYVSVRDGERLLGLEGRAARLVVRGRFLPGLEERNVLAELRGPSDETVVVSAHYDSVWRGAGAIDNASGVEAMLRIAEALAGRYNPRTVLFVAFGAEEPGLVGSRYFVHEAKLRGELNDVVGVVNLDCVAHGEPLELMVAPDELRGRALEHVARLGLDRRYRLEVTGPGPGTDHYWFAQEGIPSISLLHFPYPEYHLPADVPELADERKLADATELAVALVESQLARPVPRRSAG